MLLCVIVLIIIIILTESVKHNGKLYIVEVRRWNNHCRKPPPQFYYAEPSNHHIIVNIGSSCVGHCLCIRISCYLRTGISALHQPDTSFLWTFVQKWIKFIRFWIISKVWRYLCVHTTVITKQSTFQYDDDDADGVRLVVLSICRNINSINSENCMNSSSVCSNQKTMSTTFCHPNLCQPIQNMMMYVWWFADRYKLYSFVIRQ